MEIRDWKLGLQKEIRALTQCSHFKAAPQGGLVSPYRRGPQKKLRLGFQYSSPPLAGGDKGEGAQLVIALTTPATPEAWLGVGLWTI